jgi:hypothetical protein
MGPAGTFGGTVLDSIVKMQNNIKYGNATYLAEDTMDVFRSIKSVNMAMNAFYAFRDGILRSRKGDVLLDDVTTGEAIAMALGLPLHRVNELWRQGEMGRREVESYRREAKVLSGLYNDWYNERLVNGYGTEQEKRIIASIEEFNRLNMDIMSEINRYVDKKFISMLEEQTIELMEKQAKREAADNGL